MSDFGMSEAAETRCRDCEGDDCCGDDDDDEGDDDECEGGC